MIEKIIKENQRVELCFRANAKDYDFVILQFSVRQQNHYIISERGNEFHHNDFRAARIGILIKEIQRRGLKLYKPSQYADIANEGAED